MTGSGREPRELTKAEQNAINSLERLAKRWPQSLMLASMGGSLVVMDSEDHMFGEGCDSDLVFADLGSRIPNTGGDW